jgi:hypothetical protein
MNAKNESLENLQIPAEKNSVWEQIQQHFQTTQTSLSLRLTCEGKAVQQVGDVKSGIKEAARLFHLQNSPQKAEELVAGLENVFIRRCQQWEQVAKGAEARERAKATGGGSGSSSASNRRKLETAHNAIRNRITTVKQCIRRLRTALNRGVGLEHQINAIQKDASSSVDDMVSVADDSAPKEAPSNAAQSNKTAPVEIVVEDPIEPLRFTTCFKSLIGDGLQLDYKTAPYLDPFSNEGLKSREAIWASGQPYCLIVQWEESSRGLLNLKFWIVPKKPELLNELKLVELPRGHFKTTKIDQTIVV